jgi:F-box domain
MDRLPLELMRQIIEFLELKDLKSVRLVSPLWALTVREYLIKPTFISLPCRDDSNRLLEISRHPFFAPIIERINFDIGENDDYHAGLGSYFIHCILDPNITDEDGSAAWTEYSQMEVAKAKYSHGYCNLNTLRRSFKNLPNLKAIDVSTFRCPYTNNLLQRIWQIQSSRLLPRAVGSERFTNILYAARQLYLESVSHDRLPVQFWAQKTKVLSKVAKAFRNLHTLKICSEYCVNLNSPNDKTLFKRLCFCLRAAPLLRTLHIGFQGAEKPKMNIFECNGDFTWPHLHTLALKGMIFGQDDLVTFLLRHKSSLKRLRLGGNDDITLRMAVSTGIQLSQGTLRGLVEGIKGKGGLELEKLNMSSNFDDWASTPSTVWDFGKGVYDDEWGQIKTRTSQSELAAAVEAFLLRGKEWPNNDDFNL